MRKPCEGKQHQKLQLIVINKPDNLLMLSLYIKFGLMKKFTVFSQIEKRSNTEEFSKLVSTKTGNNCKKVVFEL